MGKDGAASVMSVPRDLREEPKTGGGWEKKTEADDFTPAIMSIMSHFAFDLWGKLGSFDDIDKVGQRRGEGREGGREERIVSARVCACVCVCVCVCKQHVCVSTRCNQP
jgi:hypothetical protein